MIRHVLGLAILLLIASPSIGHHSEAGLDMTTVVDLEGIVTEWKLQAGAVSIMSRMGWTRDSLSVGEHVNVEAHQAQDGRPYGVLASIVKADGTILPTSLDAVTGEPVLATIFPLGIEIDDEENTVIMRSGAGDYRQTVYMDGRGHPTSDERTLEGHAIGWWEEETLVIDTVGFDDHIDAYQIGVPSGARKHLVQRFRLIEGGTRIEVEFLLEDTEYLVGSLSDKREMIYSPHMEIAPWDLESATHFLK